MPGLRNFVSSWLNRIGSTGRKTPEFLAAKRRKEAQKTQKSSRGDFHHRVTEPIQFIGVGSQSPGIFYHEGTEDTEPINPWPKEAQEAQGG